MYSQILRASIVEKRWNKYGKDCDAFNNLIERKIWFFIDIKVLTRVETNAQAADIFTKPFGHSEKGNMDEQHETPQHGI